MFQRHRPVVNGYRIEADCGDDRENNDSAEIHSFIPLTRYSASVASR